MPLALDIDRRALGGDQGHRAHAELFVPVPDYVGSDAGLAGQGVDADQLAGAWVDDRVGVHLSLRYPSHWSASWLTAALVVNVVVLAPGRDLFTRRQLLAFCS
jgi:hypothetical protein